MLLTKLKILGFKSFAEKIILEFPQLNQNQGIKGITAIVGPNGSGKSNIADAVRWVLGEQSLKIIRAKSQEDIIFGGSSKKNQLNRSEVSIYLNNDQNDNNFNKLPYREIEITRRFYRNGEIKYLINNQEVRLFDITLMLTEANFGQKNYTVIGQGMIDSILQRSPQDMLDFFYDAVGVKKYQIKLNKTENKLKRTNEHLKETKLLLSETSPHLKYLSNQVKRWDQRVEIESEFKNTAQIYYSLKLNDIEARSTEKEQEYNLLNKQYQSIISKLKEIREKVRQIAELGSSEVEYQELQKIIKQKNQEKNNLLEEKIYLKKEIESKYEALGKIDLSWAYRRNSECMGIIIEQEKNLKILKNLIDNLKQTIETKNRNKNEIIQKIQKLEKQSKNSEPPKIHLDFLKIKKELEEIKNLIKNYYKIDNKKTPQNFSLLSQAEQKIDFLISTISRQFNIDQNKIDETNFKINDLKQQKEELLSLLNDLNLDLKINLEKNNLIEHNLIYVKREQKDLQLKFNKLENKQNKDELIKKIQTEKEQIEAQIEKIDNSLDIYQEKINKFNQTQEQNKQKLIVLERQNRNNQQTADHLSNLISVVKIDLTKLEEQKLNFKKEIIENLGENFIPINVKQNDYNINDLWQKILQFKKKLEMMGTADEEVIKEYKELNERHNFLEEQSQDLEQTVFSLAKIIKKLEKKIKNEFDSKFKILNLEFKKYFKILFDGGSAGLKMCEIDPEIEESLDINVETLGSMNLDNTNRKNKTDTELPIFNKIKQKGIEILALPPGKKIKTIAMLSGGEKAITFCALICAIIASNPPPFVILDEIDAALDEVNSIKLASIIKKLSKKTQFILITHNRAIMEIADILYGISMNEAGVSKILSLQLEDHRQNDESEKITKIQETITK